LKIVVLATDTNDEKRTENVGTKKYKNQTPLTERTDSATNNTVRLIIFCHQQHTKGTTAGRREEAIEKHNGTRRH